MIELDDMGLTIPVRLLRSLARHASDDPTRPHLAGIVVEPQRNRLWSTDGTRALIWSGSPVPGHELEAFSLQRSALEILFGALGERTRDPVRFTWGYRSATARLAGASLVIDIPQGLAFPPIDLVLSDAAKVRGEAVYDVQPGFFADAQFLCDAFGSGQRMRVSPGASEIDAVLVTFPHEPQWTLIAMPMRK
ncbi:MAG TPA: hypothetical protein VGK73_06785 [Polyangiaceae bacterium]